MRSYRLLRHIPSWRLRVVLYLSLLAAIAGCVAGGSSLYFQSFDFDLNVDARCYGQPEVEVLDYVYGDSHQYGTQRSSYSKELGQAIARGSVAGYLPRGEFLWFKWRVKATGRVYEDKVDLRQRLPIDLTKYGIHVVIEGAQLYVYAFPPFETRDLLGQVSTVSGQQASRARGQPFGEVPYNRAHQIYPDVVK